MEDVGSLVARYRTRGILVDTSLLLLLYVGLYDPEQIERFARTRQSFVQQDFKQVAGLLDQFEYIVTTPHILTEVSNFLGQLHGRVRDGCYEVFATHVGSETTIEHSPEGARLASSEAFVPFGITDTSIFEVAAEPYLVLTTDYRLHGKLLSKGIDAINYNHIRFTL